LDYWKPNLEIEVARFFDWRETNPNLGTSAIALWLALMDTWRRAGYPDQITVAQSVLMGKSGLQSTALKDARNMLVQAGRIEWIKRKGNQAPIYKIISFELADVKRLQARPQEQPQARPQYQPQPRPIINNNDSITTEDIIVDVVSNTNQPLNDHKPDHNADHTIIEDDKRPQEQPQNSLINVKAAIDQHGNVIQHIQKYYQQHMGNLLSPTAYMEIAEFLNEGVEGELICKAIDVSIDMNKRNWPYARSIVNNCICNNIKTLAEHEIHEANRNASKTRLGGGEKPNANNGANYQIGGEDDPYRNITSGKL